MPERVYHRQFQTHISIDDNRHSRQYAPFTLTARLSSASDNTAVTRAATLRTSTMTRTRSFTSRRMIDIPSTPRIVTLGHSRCRLH
jgi:hypothetical protein